MRHGAKVKHKQCSKEGCSKQAQQRGICIRHKAKVKHKQNQVINGGVCMRHGAKAKLCSSEGAQITFEAEECARGMEVRPSEAA